MATKTLHEVRSLPGSRQVQPGDGWAGCSAGIMAHNEEANIGRTIHAVLQQHGPSARIEEAIAVACGCTDRTVPLVAAIALQEPRVRLCLQEKREGKASAINLFLKQARSPIGTEDEGHRAIHGGSSIGSGSAGWCPSDGDDSPLVSAGAPGPPLRDESVLPGAVNSGFRRSHGGL